MSSGVKVKRLALIVMAVACLAGCVKPLEVHDATRFAQDGSAQKGLATVYVIRGDFYARSLLPIKIEVDGKSRGWLQRETSMHFNVEPGHHVLAATFPALLEPSGGMGIGAEFEKNKTYYFFWNGSGAIARPMVKFGQVAAARGVELIGTYPAKG